MLYVPEIRREYEEMFHQHIPVDYIQMNKL